MSNQNTTALASNIERARKVLQHEQRTHHQDHAIKPGGLELFAGRWADEMNKVCKQAGLDLRPVYRITEHLEGYRRQDPTQRAANIRAVLAILNELEGHTTPASAPTQVKMSASTGMAHNEKGESKAPSATHAKPSATPVATTTDTAPEKAAHTAPTPPRQAPQVQNPIHLEAGMSPGHTVLTLLSADITAVPGVGPSVAAKLQTLGIRTVRDLLFYFPREHRDYSKLE